MSRYLLGEHVRACAVGEQVILLDVRRNKYLALARGQCGGLAQLVADWPTEPSQAEPDEAGARSLLGTMIATGLVRSAASGAPPRGQPRLPQATTTLMGEYADTTVTAGPWRTTRFMYSVLSATFVLRLLGLESAVKWATSLRPAGAGDEVSSEAALRAVSTYERLRPLLYTARNECLFDSLALLAFLAREGMYPRWVIGIRTAPFGAHSWLQSGQTVVNDLPERVRKFKPILIV